MSVHQLNQQPGPHTVHFGARRSCNELGVCQGCCPPDGTNAGTYPHRDAIDVMYYTVLAVVGAVSLVTLLAGAGYIYARYFA